MISNGVRYARATSTTLREELRLTPKDRLLVSVGNLYPVKGHTHLVDAMRLLIARHPTVHLAISGRGELAEALTAQARDNGIADRVHLLGLRSDVAAILAAADVFVLPSLSEGLPLALLEAMVAARPIVATAVGEIPTALDGGRAGVLVPARDAGALASALASVLCDPAQAPRLSAPAPLRAGPAHAFGGVLAPYGTLYAQPPA